MTPTVDINHPHAATTDGSAPICNTNASSQAQHHEVTMVVSVRTDDKAIEEGGGVVAPDPQFIENEDEEEDEGGEAKAEADPKAAPEVKAKKKKRKKKSKAKQQQGGTAATGPVKEPSVKPEFRGLKETAFTDYFVKHGQTDPPTIPVADLFKGKEWPTGEVSPHPNSSSASSRESAAELRAREVLHEDLVSKVRLGAEIHRQVRAYAQGIIQPGIKLEDMCTALENKNRELVVEKGIERGIGFPTGCSLNYVAAHYTPNTGDDTVLKYDDVMKVRLTTRLYSCSSSLRSILLGAHDFFLQIVG
jgi:methionyl aminopeptidase